MKIINKLIFNTLYGILNIINKDDDYFDTTF
jgi:hypothetical protein